MKKLLFIAALLFSPAAWAQQGPSQLDGGVYNASPATLSDKQSTTLQFDNMGNLKTVNGGAPAGTQDVNLIQVGGAAIALGQALAASALPVVLPALQVITTGLIGNSNLSTQLLSVDVPANATSIATLEDTASGDGDKLVKIACVRKATPTDTGGTDGDYEQIECQGGFVYVTSPGSFDIASAITTSNNSITTGESLGGLQTLANAVRASGAIGDPGTSGIIQKIALGFSDAVVGTSADIYFFNANPSSSTCTDNTAFALNSADLAKVIYVVHVTDFTASNTAIMAQAGNIAAPFSLASATSIFACIVARSTWAVTGTSNAKLLTTIIRN